LKPRFIIRAFCFEDDFDDVINLWRGSGDGIQLRESDRPEEIRKKLERDPDLFLVAINGDTLIGAVMGAFDGRRGYIYHLAVADHHRQEGVAKMLMAEVERCLRAKGCIKINLLVTPENKSAMSFYQGIGYERMNVVPFGKILK
jgi:ribosomal protein S18 acetylase RimI-like enzyme